MAEKTRDTAYTISDVWPQKVITCHFADTQNCLSALHTIQFSLFPVLNVNDFEQRFKSQRLRIVGSLFKAMIF